MTTFKAKKAKSKYKNTEGWIDAVYRNNKVVIDKELSKFGSPKRIFKKMVEEHMEEGMSPTAAMKTIARSTLFTSEKERIRNNMMTALKEDKAAYKAFRELTKEKGKYTKFDPSKLVWNKDEHVYQYNDVVISFQNSPYEVKVWKQ